jgi:hypothetical protein
MRPPVTRAALAAPRNSSTKRFASRPLVLLGIGLLTALAPAPAHAGEGYMYSGVGPMAQSFYLMGGQYELYVHAQAYGVVPSPSDSPCIFGGVLGRIAPVLDQVIHLGPGSLTVFPPAPYLFNPTLTLPAGIYRFDLNASTNCTWKLLIGSTANNTADLGVLQMARRSAGALRASATASVRDTVQFYAAYRTDHNAQHVPFSGTLAIINGGRVVQTFPVVLAGHDNFSASEIFYIYVQFDASDAKYVGKNTAKMIVKIGESAFTSSVEFTLTP